MQIQNKVQKFFLVAFFVLMLLSVFVPGVSRAITAAEQKRCNDLAASLEIKVDETRITDPDAKKQNGGNLAEGLPDFCTANNLLQKVIYSAVIIAGSIAVLFIIVGGFWYLTSAGNEEQAEKGRKTAVNAILGLVLIVMSFAIIKIIVSLLTSGSSTAVNTTQVNTPKPDPVVVTNHPNTPAWAKEGTDFTFTNMASGVYKQGNVFYFKDFAMVADYYGSGVANLRVVLSDSQGLNYEYTRDNLEEPLVIDASVKKTVLLNVANVAFPSTEDKYEYHPNITVHVTSDQPIHMLPPDQFAASGSGATVNDATENAWRGFGFQPPSLAINNTEYTAYAIFWRNMRAFPGGWDTEFTLRNNASQPIQVTMKYLPDYFKKYDSDCNLLSSQTVNHMDISLPANGSYNVTLSKYLNLTTGDVATTEGAVAFEFPNSDGPARTEVTEHVVPLSGGVKCGSG